MIIQRINLNHLFIFIKVFESKSMTDAAQDLGLTQSGISQHIRTLEDHLGFKLFDRVKQKLIPTGSGKLLFEQCAPTFRKLEQSLEFVAGPPQELSGVVTLGTPIEFGINVVMPLIAQFRKEHPLVQFQFTLDFASQLNQGLLEGTIDFAFVDDFPMDAQIKTDQVYNEVFDLCISKELSKKYGPSQNSKKFYESMEYVEYQRGGPILKKWFKHHLKADDLNLHYSAIVMDVWGVARLIHSGMGAGILPSHLTQRFKREGYDLQVFEGCGKPLLNSIHLAALKDRNLSFAAKSVMEFLFQKIKASMPKRA